MHGSMLILQVYDSIISFKSEMDQKELASL